ncbi:MAG: germination protein YpeB, partial [Clostridia bacterium]|nr:germination protein YpeB [Clostridia bacterium]
MKNVKAFSIFTAVTLILAVSAVYYSARTQKYERYITHLSDRAFSDIITSVNAVATSLDKMQYATEGKYMNTLAANVWREAMGAKAALSLLPLSDVELDETQKFISQSGAYAYSILQRGVDDDTQTNIMKLSQTADGLTEKLWEVKTRLNNGEISFDLLRDDTDVSVSDMEEGISDIETDFPEMGNLIYDGPYSDHIELMKPAFLEDKPEV